MDGIYLKHVIDFSHGNGGRLVLSGDLTEATVLRLTEKLGAVGARPKVADVGGVRFADAGALVALGRWVRRSGWVGLPLVKAAPQLVDLVARNRLHHVLPATPAPAARGAIAA